MSIRVASLITMIFILSVPHGVLAQKLLSPKASLKKAWATALKDSPLPTDTSQNQLQKAFQFRLGGEPLDGVSANPTQDIQELRAMVSRAEGDHAYWLSKVAPDDFEQRYQVFLWHIEAAGNVSREEAKKQLRKQLGIPEDKTDDRPEKEIGDRYWNTTIREADVAARLKQSSQVLQSLRSALQQASSQFSSQELGRYSSTVWKNAFESSGGGGLFPPSKKALDAMSADDIDKARSALTNADRQLALELLRGQLQMIRSTSSNPQMSAVFESEIRKLIKGSDDIWAPGANPSDDSDPEFRGRLTNEFPKDFSSPDYPLLQPVANTSTFRDRQALAYKVDEELQEIAGMLAKGKIAPERFETYYERLTAQRKALGDVGNETVVKLSHYSEEALDFIDSLEVLPNPTKLLNNAASVITGYDELEGRFISADEIELRESELASELLHNAGTVVGGGVARNSLKAFNKLRALKTARATNTASVLLSAPQKIKNVVVRSADEVNDTFRKRGYRPPYAGSRVREFQTTQELKFLRVHGNENQARSWIMRTEEIKGLSPKQIQDKYSLPEFPTFVSEVRVPPQTRMRMGKAASQEGWGGGGGMQYELLDKIDNSFFGTPTPLQ